MQTGGGSTESFFQYRGQPQASGDAGEDQRGAFGAEVHGEEDKRVAGGALLGGGGQFLAEVDQFVEETEKAGGAGGRPVLVGVGVWGWLGEDGRGGHGVVLEHDVRWYVKGFVPRPKPMKIDTRPARSEDLNWLADVFPRSLREAITVTRGSWDFEHESAQFRAQLQIADTRVIRVESNDVGLVAVLAVDENLLEVHTLCLQPDRQGAGVGTRIMQDVMTAARTAGSAVELSVLKSNSDAGALLCTSGLRQDRRLDAPHPSEMARRGRGLIPWLADRDRWYKSLDFARGRPTNPRAYQASATAGVAVTETWHKHSPKECFLAQPEGWTNQDL